MIHSGAAVLTSTLWMGRDIQYLWQKVIYTTSILTVVNILCTSKEKRLSLHAWSAETLDEFQLLPSICSYPHTFGRLFCSANRMIISFKSWDFLYLTESARLVVSESISITMKNKFSDKRNNVHIRWIACKSKLEIQYEFMIVEPVPFIHFAWDWPRN